MTELNIATPKSAKEYNEVFRSRIDNAKGLFKRLPHALSKSGAADVCLKCGGKFRTVYDEAMRQLEMIGWGPEMEKTIHDALVVYRQYLLDSLKTPQEADEPAEWVETEETDGWIPRCSSCGTASNVDGDEYIRRGKVRYLYEETCPYCGKKMKNHQ